MHRSRWPESLEYADTRYSVKEAVSGVRYREWFIVLSSVAKGISYLGEEYIGSEMGILLSNDNGGVA